MGLAGRGDWGCEFCTNRGVRGGEGGVKDLLMTFVAGLGGGGGGEWGERGGRKCWREMERLVDLGREGERGYSMGFPTSLPAKRIGV